LCICGKEKLDWKLLASLKDALMESDLPFRVDVLDYHSAPEHFRAPLTGTFSSFVITTPPQTLPKLCS
jgi:hypothetical protein